MRGTFAHTQRVLEKVKMFLKHVMCLDINDSKTNITNLNEDKVVFLGTNVFRSKHVNM